MATPCKFKDPTPQLLQIMQKLEAINTILNSTIIVKLNKLVELCEKISEKLKKTAEWLKLPHILNVLTFATVIHNAAMLSNSLKDTLLEVLSQCLAVVGIKDDQDNPYDFVEIFNQNIQQFLKAILGEEVYNDTVEKWKKTIRVYQAAANLLYAFQSIGFSILDALETIGQWQAEIGNTLQKWGVLGEKAYSWMWQTPNFQNKFFTKIDDVEDFVSSIGAVAAEILDAQETVASLEEMKTELDQAAKDWIDEFGNQHDSSKEASGSSEIEEKDLESNLELE